ncbi:hypothetical protein Q5752_006573 [Cryptotrichosporon argae]
MLFSLLFLPLALAAPSFPQTDDAFSLSWTNNHVASPGTWNVDTDSIAKGHDDKNKKTSILELLRGEEQFSRIVKIIEFAGYSADLDNDHKDITFMAPVNSALVPYGNHLGNRQLKKELEHDPMNLLLLAAVLESDSQLYDFDKDLKKKIKENAHRFCLYNTLTKSLGEQGLLQQSSHPTRLEHDGVLGRKRFEMQVERKSGDPFTTINGDRRCMVAACHKVGHSQACESTCAVEVPGSAFDVVYESPDTAVYTSIVQQLDERDRLDSRRGRELVTALVYTDIAYRQLPDALQVFLSQRGGMGERTTRALTNCFMLRDVYLTAGEICKRRKDVECKHINDLPAKFEIDGACKLDIRIDEHKVDTEFKYRQRTISVNDVLASSFDIPSTTGPILFFDTMPLPCREVKTSAGEKVKCEWETWELWLLEWAEQNGRDRRDRV